MYSTEELALKSVTDAIDQLDAIRRRAGAHGLEGQVAAVWAMVGEVNPELAKVASQYGGQPWGLGRCASDAADLNGS